MPEEPAAIAAAPAAAVAAQVGLTAGEVAESRRQHGANILTPPVRPPWWRLYLEKFKDPIIRILLVAAVVALLVGLQHGDFIEGVGILVAVLLSTGLSFFNEYRAAQEFDILNQVSDGEDVPVIRDGRHQTVPKKDIVVGDVVLAEQGAEISADGTVIEAMSLSVNESSLTGESVPVAKRPEGEAADGEAGEHAAAYAAHILLRGTTISDGHGLYRVTAVGDATEIGKTARAAAEDAGTMTPLARQLEKLAGVLSIGAFLAAGIIFVAQTIRGAANGEIFDLAERAGRIIQVPLTAGQWYAFAVAVVAVLLLCAGIWSPVVREAFTAMKWRVPDCLTRFAGWGPGYRAASAGVALAAGLAFGLLSDLLRFGSGPEWLPFSAFGAFLSYFMVAVTVIVVAVPEGLPMCVTLALAYSMRKMTAENNLVRKMHACETIGAASVICSDKTGTLTMNEMRVHRAFFPFTGDGALPASGAGADRLAEAIAANSTANLQSTPAGTAPMGNPTEGALLMWLHASERDYHSARAAFKVSEQLTFSTERKFMATAGTSAVDGARMLYAKGAAEIIMPHCTVKNGPAGPEPLGSDEKARILSEAAEYQNRGMRILGFASRVLTSADDGAAVADCVHDMAWDGFFAIADPIRPDVPAAMEKALGAGMQVKIVTGDNQATAREIARQAGLWKDTDTDEQIITGDVFEALPDDEAAAAAARIKVMSRARPLHKLRLVNLLQKQGEVVAVTGDGTNDAPALNHADVGLAMGKTGTSVAKEAADIILLDDSFNSIVNAVAWGRSLYANIQKFVVFQLTINVAAVGIALLGPFLGVTLPLTVIQMLWVNLIMDTFAALALASEPPDWSLMRRPPRAADSFIITDAMKRVILGTGLSFLLLFLCVLALGRWFPLDASVDEGRRNLTIFFTAFVFLQFWNLWNARVFGGVQSAFRNLCSSRGFLAMAAVIVIGQYLLVQFGGAMFRVVPLSAGEWLAIILLTSPALLIGEISRLHKRRGQDADYWVYS